MIIWIYAKYWVKTNYSSYCCLENRWPQTLKVGHLVPVSRSDWCAVVVLTGVQMVETLGSKPPAHSSSAENNQDRKTGLWAFDLWTCGVSFNVGDTSGADGRSREATCRCMWRLREMRVCHVCIILIFRLLGWFSRNSDESPKSWRHNMHFT